ncbi:non-ribosomal peptide synthetase [Streptomyces sp. CA-132043]|uniref:non-ribosomal peptide synthetase n=1 Tax=Streptomyces sp. CA-132043 TaxID=3240048 RepID=UPI003D946B3B
MGCELAPNQVDLYTADHATDDPATYLVNAVYRITGPLDADLLARRLERLLDAHPVLAARVVRDGESWLLEAAPDRPQLTCAVLDTDPDGASARQRVHDELRVPLDLAKGPLLRVVLLRHRPQTADLLIVAHHLVVDGHSMGLIARALLTDTVESGPDFAEWAAAARGRQSARSADAPAIRAELAAADSAPSLDWAAPDGPPAEDGPAGGVAEAIVPAALHESIRRLGADLGITAHSVVLAAAGFVIGRNSGCATPVIGTTVSRRPAAHSGTVGYFNTTAPVPVGLDDESTVSEFLRAVHRRGVRAYRDADLPLSAVWPASARTAPQVVLAAIDALPHLTEGEPAAVPHADQGLGTAHFPLTIGLYQQPGQQGGIRMLLRHQRALVDDSAAALFFRQLLRVLDEFTGDPAKRLGAVTTLTGPELLDGLATGRGTPLDVPADTLAQRFARQAAEAADRTAVVCGADRLTYRELDQRSRNLAAALGEAGVRPGDRVGVCLDRGIGQVTAVLAVLRAGAAYVPLDPDYPPQRLAFVIEDTGLHTVITADGLLSAADGLSVVPVDAVPEDPERPLPSFTADATAYIIHTSGSTGRPKGVLVSHRNVIALLAATETGYAPGPDDVWTYFHSLAFDFSVWEIWGCLLSGGRLVVVPYDVSRDAEAFHALLRAEGVTVLNQTPSAFAQLVGTRSFQDGGLAVRLLIFGGEALDRGVLLPWIDRYPEDVCRAVNMYGITETTVFCTWHTVDREEARRGSRSIGRPVPGWDVYVLDGRGRPVPPGVPGELYIGGAGVTQGYLNRPELNAERFLDGLPDLPGRRLYRSGDLGRFLPDGRVEYLGRLDEQVKIRGHRIEPGEIRHSLLEDPRVRAAACVVRVPGGPDTARVDAYVVTDEPDALADIRHRLADRLPGHALPATLTAVPELPLTPNGKLDTARLPEPASTAPGPGQDTAPEEPDGPWASVARTWQEVLGVPVGADDSFFDLGGTSVQAVLLVTALREDFPEVRLRDIFRNSTPRRLAAALGRHAAQS